MVLPATVLASLPAFTIHLINTLGRSEHTGKAYVSDVRSFAKFLVGLDDHENPTPEGASHMASVFVTWLKQTERNGPSTVKRKLAALGVYFTWLVRHGQLERSPFDASSIEVRLPKRLPRAVPRQDVIRLFQSCAPADTIDDRSDTELALRLLVGTGVRISELCAINVAERSPPDGTSIRIRGKGNRERTVFVSNPDLQRQLMGACARRRAVQSGVVPLLVKPKFPGAQWESLCGINLL